MVLKKKYEERIVAFIDILGFKNIVNDDSKCEEIGAILKLPYVIRQENMIKLLKIKGIMITSISDSLVFSIKVKEHGAMRKLVMLLLTLTELLLTEYGLLIRGSIAIGKVYHDNEVVYGPGLVKAYELESQNAIYPRIVILPDDLLHAIASCRPISRSVLQEYFVPDFDGLLRLDSFCYSNAEKLMRAHSRLKEMNMSNIRIRQKIDWIMSVIDIKIKNL